MIWIAGLVRFLTCGSVRGTRVRKTHTIVQYVGVRDL
jgi:hypothetical protein